MDQQKTQRLGHNPDHKLRLRYTQAAFTIVLACTLTGCTPKPTPTPPLTTKPTTTYPPQPATPPPPFHLIHQSPTNITLVTSETASDDQIAAILYQLRDAARTHTFDQLKIPQKLVDARDPMIWFHLYRGAKCAAEKYSAGAPPCGPSYHAAGDFTLGGFTDHNHATAVLLHGEDHPTPLWNPDIP